MTLSLLEVHKPHLTLSSATMIQRAKNHPCWVPVFEDLSALTKNSKTLLFPVPISGSWLNLPPWVRVITPGFRDDILFSFHPYLLVNEHQQSHREVQSTGYNNIHIYNFSWFFLMILQERFLTTIDLWEQDHTNLSQCALFTYSKIPILISSCSNCTKNYSEKEKENKERSNGLFTSAKTRNKYSTWPF